MENKKTKILSIGAIIGILVIGSLFYINSSKGEDRIDKDTNTSNNKVESNAEVDQEIIEFLSAISGVKANNLEIINNPVGFKAQLLAPKESILNGVDYFLENTENDKMKDLNINLGDGFINVAVSYEVMPNLNTPIEVKVVPSLNSDKDLVLNIEEVKFLDLKIAKWIVDIGIKNFVQDWFPKDQDFNVDFNEGKVVIYKENFEGVNLEKLVINPSGLTIDTILDLQKIVGNTQVQK